jgi:hypothetical protein
MSENDLSADGREMDPAQLAEITRAALPYLGPFSITAVKRASRGCNDLHTLCDLVAGQISEPDKRQRFTEAAARLVQRLADPNGRAGTAAAASADPGEAGKAGNRVPAPITPELMQRGEKALAHVIGPLAGVLVARYAKSAENSWQFFDLLAGHIRNPEERQAFFEIIRAQSVTD